MGLFGFGKKKDEKTAGSEAIENTTAVAAELTKAWREALKRRDAGDIREVTDHGPLASALTRTLTCHFCGHGFGLTGNLRDGKESDVPGVMLMVKCPSCGKNVFSLA